MKVTPAKSEAQKYRQVRYLTVKRMNLRVLNPGNQDKYGHWWIEFGDPYDPTSESYGWWPKQRVGVGETLTGVEGELNATSRMDSCFIDESGLAFRDPHHGDPADTHFHPLVPINDTRSDSEIADCIRQRARKFTGTWQWVFEAGQNCHTFQLELLRRCGLIEPPEEKSRIHSFKYA